MEKQTLEQVQKILDEGTISKDFKFLTIGGTKILHFKEIHELFTIVDFEAAALAIISGHGNLVHAVKYKEIPFIILPMKDAQDILKDEEDVKSGQLNTGLILEEALKRIESMYAD